MSKTAVCPDHGHNLPPACPECEAIMSRPADRMTGDERADELQHWFDTVLTVEFPKLHKRIEGLVGRPVWTHEMGTQGAEWLVKEARTQRHPDDLEAHVIGSLGSDSGHQARHRRQDRRAGKFQQHNRRLSRQKGR